jgi:hypothetical protein
MLVFEKNPVYNAFRVDLYNQIRMESVVQDSSSLVIVQSLVLVSLLGIYAPSEFDAHYYIAIAVQKAYKVDI